jgi:hypothetical protein
MITLSLLHQQVKSAKAFVKCITAMLIVLALSITAKAQDVVDATTMSNKVLAGYQGWFRIPGDRPENKNWVHLFNTPGVPWFDTWPDMSEYDADEKFAAPGFTYPDGSQAHLFTAQNPKTVMRHFKWMKEYGIDGVWLSQFCDHFPGGTQEADTTGLLTIQRNVQAAAKATGRTWAYMWDMTGFKGQATKSSVYNIMINQWKKMVDQGVTSDPRYMHEKGKPVLLIWGFFPDRPASQPDFMNPVIDFLQAPGKYQAVLISGVEPTWRENGTPEFKAMLMRMSGLQPWSVGRRLVDPNTGYWIQNTTLWEGDMAMCKANNVVFQPVFNSGTHLSGPPPVLPALPWVPRRTGNYLWEQFVRASKFSNINSAFVAMFDEINEGTQIFKVTSKPPVERPFLTNDGATNDYYLRLVSLGAKMIKSHVPITPVIPISPFSTAKSYKIKNKANGLFIGNKGKAAPGVIQIANENNAGNDWQIVYDGKGYFKIKNRLSGKVLGLAGNQVSQVADVASNNNTKWHLEWDGTGYCRIVNKTGAKALSNNNTAIANVPVVHTVDAPGIDNLRWKIIEQ